MRVPYHAGSEPAPIALQQAALRHRAQGIENRCTKDSSFNHVDWIMHRCAGSALFAIILISMALPLHAQKAQQGRRVFQRYCSICHTVQPGRTLVGPSLFGVVGRHAGAMPGFHYTDANRHSGLTWDPATLDRYLAAPRKVVPGTAMTFPGLQDSEARAEVIAYLQSLR